MTHSDDFTALLEPAVLEPEAQRAVWFLGALARIRLTGAATGGRLAVLEHLEERGHASPLHRHDVADETFLVLEGELRVAVDGQVRAVGAGAVAFLPRQLPHGFIVTSPQARFLTLHTPSGFDEFTIAAGKPAMPGDEPPLDEVPDQATLVKLAKSYGIEILGPPMTL